MFTLKYELRSATVEARSQDGIRVQTWHDLTDTVCAFGYAGPGWWAMEWPRMATFRIDASAPETVRVFHEPGVSRERLDDLYRRSVVPLFLQALGCETLHASAVSSTAGVLAFCGERGAGKSTVAYALARRGFEQYADDTLVLDISGSAITTRPLPFAPRLRPASADYFACGPAFSPSSEADRRVGRSTMPAALAGVFILRPSPDASREAAVSNQGPTQAFQALLAHAHCFEPDSPAARRRLLNNYLEVSGRVPVFEVSYAPGLDRLDTLIDAILDAAGTTCGTPVAV